jgi:hypothetical protein
VFNGQAELWEPPTQYSGADLLQQGREQAQWLRDGGIEDGADDPVKLHGVKRANILNALPYWQVRVCFLSNTVQSPLFRGSCF